MINNKILILFFCVSSSMFSQINVTFLDGKTMPVDITKCAQNFENYSKYKSIAKEFCACWFLNLGKKVSYDDFLNNNFFPSINSGGNKGEKALNIFQSQYVKDATQECISPEVSKLLGNTKITDEEINIFAKEHLIQLKKELGIAGYNELQKSIYLTGYSRCYFKKIFQQYSFQDMSNISKEMQARLEKIQESCFSENMRQINENLKNNSDNGWSSYQKDEFQSEFKTFIDRYGALGEEFSKIIYEDMSKDMSYSKTINLSENEGAKYFESALMKTSVGWSTEAEKNYKTSFKKVLVRQGFTKNIENLLNCNFKKLKINYHNPLIFDYYRDNDTLQLFYLKKCIVQLIIDDMQ